MKRYKILKAKTNLGREFYIIKKKVSLLWGLITFWVNDVDDLGNISEYTLVEAQKWVKVWEQNRLEEEEEIIYKEELQ